MSFILIYFLECIYSEFVIGLWWQLYVYVKSNLSST